MITTLMTMDARLLLSTIVSTANNEPTATSFERRQAAEATEKHARVLSRGPAAP